MTHTTDTQLIELTIDSIGHEADGIATLDDEKVFIPYTLPGETVLVERPQSRRHKQSKQLFLREVKKESEDRQKPFCPLFTQCGGCSAQHMTPEYYSTWKRNALAKTLSQHGVETPLADTVSVPHKSRRRVSMSYKHMKEGNFILGFRRAMSNFTIDIDTCPLIVDELNALIAPTKELLHKITLPGSTGFVNITAVENGFDFVWSPHRKIPIDLSIIDPCTEFAQQHRIVQMTRAGKEIIFKSNDAVINFNGVKIAMPPSAFLQPSIEGEHALVNLAVDAIDEYAPNATRFADLFSGLGTFTIPLAQRPNSKVVAADIFSPSVEKLTDKGFQNIKVEDRNLFEEPLDADELNKLDVVVLDPPRAGCFEQAKKLADSDVKLVVYVSCGPATFARDAAILMDGGYELEKLTPVDQFPYTPHLELVGVFIKR